MTLTQHASRKGTWNRKSQTGILCQILPQQGRALFSIKVPHFSSVISQVKNHVNFSLGCFSILFLFSFVHLNCSILQWEEGVHFQLSPYFLSYVPHIGILTEPCKFFNSLTIVFQTYHRFCCDSVAGDFQFSNYLPSYISIQRVTDWNFVLMLH